MLERDGLVDQLPLGRLDPRAAPGPASSICRARTSPIRRGSIHETPLSGVKPRSQNGAQKRASSAATVTSAASASASPMPASPALHGADHRRLHGLQQRDQPVRLGGQPALDAARPAAASHLPPRALRATTSAPLQKCSPSAASAMTRTASSRPAASSASMSPAHHLVVEGVALRLAGRASGAAPRPRQRRSTRRRDRTRSLVLEPFDDGVERGAEAGAVTARWIGQPHRPVLAAGQQDRRVTRGGDDAALVGRARCRCRPPAARPRRGSLRVTSPRIHWVSPT